MRRGKRVGGEWEGEVGRKEPIDGKLASDGRKCHPF